MKRKSLLWATAAFVGLLLVGYAAADLYWGSIGVKARNKYGPAPVLGWFKDEGASLRTGQYCQYVASPNPPVHWNWRGDMWQEPYLLWEDVQLLSPAPTELVHGKTGPVREGDIVCGWATHGTEATIYRPWGTVMTCNSYEPRLDPPCD